MEPTATRWLLALDVDRTALTNDYRLLPAVRDAVQRARKAGIAVSLATARGPVALEVVLRDLGEIDAAICFGGALVLKRDQGVWTPPHNQGSARGTVEKESALLVASICRELGVSFAAYGRDTVFVSEVDARLAKEFSHTGDQYEVADVASLDVPIFKFLVISKVEESEKLAVLKNRLDGLLSCATSHVNYLEVGPLGISKGTGLAVLAQSLGVDRQHTVAIGDGENDIPMFGWAGLSIAMGHAAQEVRDAADWTILSNAEAGVAAAIDRLFERTWSAVARSEA
jgi:5-amino-6-(5-phospho-D-ribitylamino)uracil phosphatase